MTIVVVVVVPGAGCVAFVDDEVVVVVWLAKRRAPANPTPGSASRRAGMGTVVDIEVVAYEVVCTIDVDVRVVKSVSVE